MVYGRRVRYETANDVWAAIVNPLCREWSNFRIFRGSVEGEGREMVDIDGNF